MNVLQVITSKDSDQNLEGNISVTLLVGNYSALWVVQSGTGLKPMDCINKSGLIKGSEVFWLILQSQIVIRLDNALLHGLNPVMHCYLSGTFV